MARPRYAPAQPRPASLAYPTPKPLQGEGWCHHLTNPVKVPARDGGYLSSYGAGFCYLCGHTMLGVQISSDAAITFEEVGP